MSLPRWKSTLTTTTWARVHQRRARQSHWHSALAMAGSACSPRLDQSSLLRPHNSQAPKFLLQHDQTRCFWSDLPMTTLLPEFTIWGGTGWMLKSLHMNGTLPYGVCLALTNVLVRTTLFPMVLHTAHTAARFARVAPEVQFLITLFQNDLKQQRQKGASFGEQRILIRTTLQTLGGIYKLHKVNPLTVFLSPLLQIPFFWYVSIDLRKIINGADPELAQQLTESPILWITDLTDPDPFYGLPIISGLLLYANVEMAVGRQSLSGSTASHSNIAKLLKDFFQSLAIFMPCFVSQSPAGVQIYLATSFVFTLCQGQALRTDTFRRWFGLPSLNAPHPEPMLANEFIEFKKLEQRAREERGGEDVPVLGQGVLAVGYETSFAGTNRPSTIIGSPWSLSSGVVNPIVMPHTRMTVAPTEPIGRAPFIHGISAPPDQFMDVHAPQMSTTTTTTATTNNNVTPNSDDQVNYLVQAPEEVMEAANKGIAPVRMAPVEPEKAPAKLSLKRFQRKKGNPKPKKR